MGQEVHEFLSFHHSYLGSGSRKWHAAMLNRKYSETFTMVDGNTLTMIYTTLAQSKAPEPITQNDKAPNRISLSEGE